MRRHDKVGNSKTQYNHSNTTLAMNLIEFTNMPNSLFYQWLRWRHYSASFFFFVSVTHVTAFLTTTVWKKNFDFSLTQCYHQAQDNPEYPRKMIWRQQNSWRKLKKTDNSFDISQWYKYRSYNFLCQFCKSPKTGSTLEHSRHFSLSRYHNKHMIIY